MDKIFTQIFADKVSTLLFCGMVVALILGIVLLVLVILLMKKYKAFMAGENGNSLEKQILKHIDDIDSLKIYSEDVRKHLKRLDENMVIAYQKAALRKYDAFDEMGGHLSFSLCMLDANDDGFILSSMHTREGCYSYIKEIIKGEGFVLLSDEEKKTLTEAKNGTNK